MVSQLGTRMTRSSRSLNALRERRIGLSSSGCYVSMSHRLCDHRILMASRSCGGMPVASGPGAGAGGAGGAGAGGGGDTAYPDPARSSHGGASGPGDTAYPDPARSCGEGASGPGETAYLDQARSSHGGASGPGGTAYPVPVSLDEVTNLAMLTLEELGEGLQRDLFETLPPVHWPAVVRAVWDVVGDTALRAQLAARPPRRQRAFVDDLVKERLRQEEPSSGV